MKVLILKDAVEGQALLERLEREGHPVREIADGDSALAELAGGDCVIWVPTPLRDVETGLPNRAAFAETLSAELGRALRDCKPLALIMAEIDPPASAKAIAPLLSAALSRPGDLLARVGERQFAIVLPGTHVAGGGVVAEEMREKVLGLGATASFGVTAVDARQQLGGEAFLAAAEKALLTAQARGGNCVAESGLDGVTVRS